MAPTILRVDGAADRLSGDERQNHHAAAAAAALDAYATTCCRVAAELIRDALPQAARALFDTTVGPDGQYHVALHTIIDNQGITAWHAQPATATETSLSEPVGMDPPLRRTIEQALLYAYQSNPGFFPYSRHHGEALYEVTICEALTADPPLYTGEVLSRSLDLFGLSTEDDLRDLETALGMSRSSLGTTPSGQTAEVPLHVADRGGVDLASLWARRRGLIYEIRSTTRFLPEPDPMVPLPRPLTSGQARQRADGTGRFSAVIAIPLNDLIALGAEEVRLRLSELIVGNPGACEHVSECAVGVSANGQAVHLLVTVCLADGLTGATHPVVHR